MVGHGVGMALSLLFAVGYATPRDAAPVPRGGWLDRVGAFWLLACGLGPLAGLALTTPSSP